MESAVVLMSISLVGLALFALGYTAGRQHNRIATDGAKPLRRGI